MKMIALEDITLQDIDFLWKIMNVRDKREFFDGFPTYEQHVNFVKKFLTQPEKHHYKKYKIVLLNKNRIGCVLLMKRNNELGYYLLPEFQNKGYGSIALSQLMDEAKMTYYTALIHNYNEGSKRFFERLGAKSEGVWYKIKK